MSYNIFQLKIDVKTNVLSLFGIGGYSGYKSICPMVWGREDKHWLQA
jgi:hypothetical protein